LGTTSAAAATPSSATAARAAPFPIAAETSARTVGGAALSGARFVHLQNPPAHFLAIQPGNGFGRFVVVRHLDKGEPSSAAGLAVFGNVDARDLAERLKKLTQLVFRRLKVHVAYEKILHLFLLPLHGRPQAERTPPQIILALPNRLKSLEGTQRQLPCTEFRQSRC
jgi:hypothetical protein